jgi:hypothetical protein
MNEVKDLEMDIVDLGEAKEVTKGGSIGVLDTPTTQLPQKAE